MKTAWEISLLIIVSVASFYFLYVVFRHWLDFSLAGSILILAPTALLFLFAAVYGYYIGFQRYHHGASADARVCRLCVYIASLYF